MCFAYACDSLPSRGGRHHFGRSPPSGSRCGACLAEKPFQLRVLARERAQPLGVRDVHATELRLSLVEGATADSALAAGRFVRIASAWRSGLPEGARVSQMSCGMSCDVWLEQVPHSRNSHRSGSTHSGSIRRSRSQLCVLRSDNWWGAADFPLRTITKLQLDQRLK